MAATLTKNTANHVDRIRKIGTKGIEDEVLAANIIMTNTLSLAIGVAMLVIAPFVFILTGKTYIIISVIIEFVINLSVIFINHSKRPIAASLTLYFLQCVAIAHFCFLLGGIIQLQFMITFLVSVICLIFSGKQLRKISFIAAIVTLAVVQVGYYYNIFQPIPINRDAGFIIQSLAIGGVLFMIIVVSQPYIRSNDLQYELKKANRFKRIFVAEVTHELRTPLNTIYLTAQLLKRDIKLNNHLKSIEPLIDQQLFACNTARNIINNVLDFAQIEAGKTTMAEERTGLTKEFFTQLIDGHRVLAKINGLKLKLTIEAMPAAMICDWQQLQQVITNLLSNAIKYSSKKGSTIFINITGNGHGWTLRVNNSGAISPDKLATIFDPFVKDNATHIESTGLGLFIVNNKVKAMQGSIVVESENNTTTFTASFPLREGKAEDVPPETNDLYNLSNIEVLVADDNKMNAMLLANFLTHNECKVTLAADGREALAKVEELFAENRLPDIIVLDHQMPELDGMQTLKRLKADIRFKDIPVVFATGDSQHQQAIKAAGAADIVVKPINEKALLQVLNQHIRSSGELLQD